MSGIVGLYDRTGESVDDGLLEHLCDRIAYRGPGDPTRWCDRAVGFGHQLLETTPEARYETLPEAHKDLVITADVRIDNRAELLEALSFDAEHTQIPDSRLIAAAYREWGRQCPTRLVGAFAFAIWDRTRERLFCARDHVGIKPCYYHATSDLFALASTVPTLLAHPDVHTTRDEQRIGDYLAGRFEDGRRTFFESIDRLPPGHSLTITENECQVRQYWSLEDIEPLPPAPKGHYERRFRELFEAAVSSRLRSPGTVGSLLSGGLDSSSITAMAGHLHEERGESPVHTVSAVFDEITACDEREYIDAVVESGAFVPHTVDGDRIAPLGDVDSLLRDRREPYYPSLCMLLPRLYETAADQDATVVLHGYGGDQTMGSDVRGYFRGLACRGKVHTLTQEIRAYCRRYPWHEPATVAWRDVLRPLAPEPIRRLRHACFEEGHYTETAMASIDPTFARRIGLDERLRRDALSAYPHTQQAVRRQALAADEPAFNLELNDAMAAAAGVEARYPYFDKRLVEFALALPPGTTVDAGLDRTIVRDGLADVLPRAVRERDDKMEFSPNVCHTVETYDLERIEETLFRDTSAVESYMDHAELQAAFDRVRRSDGTITDVRNLLMATTLERWLELSQPQHTKIYTNTK